MKNILCRLFGHKYYVYAKPVDSWGAGVRWLRCSRCKRDFAINDRVKVLLPMDFELMNLHQWKILERRKINNA